MPAPPASQYVMAYVTAPDRRSAQRIARTVLEARLAACANLVPIDSLYWWHGSLERAKEFLVIFKTRKPLARRLIAAVRAVHPYEVPCVVTYPMQEAFAPYLAWIDRETRPQR